MKIFYDNDDPDESGMYWAVFRGKNKGLHIPFLFNAQNYEFSFIEDKHAKLLDVHDEDYVCEDCVYVGPIIFPQTLIEKLFPRIEGNFTTVTLCYECKKEVDYDNLEHLENIKQEIKDSLENQDWYDISLDRIENL